MRFVNNITEEEMVAVFLRAELKSTRWSKRILETLKKNNLDKEIIEKPDVTDNKENGYRAKTLGEIRGYKKDSGFFEGFPNNVKWVRAMLNKDELRKARYINYSYWIELSGGSRLLKGAVRNIKKGVEVFGQSNKQFFKLAKLIDKGEKFPEIILVGTNEREKFVILEGHVRLTAYFLAKNPPTELEAIVGYSKDTPKWSNY